MLERYLPELLRLLHDRNPTVKSNACRLLGSLCQEGTRSGGLRARVNITPIEFMTESLREALPDIFQLLKEDLVRLSAATAIELSSAHGILGPFT
jgi:HEAT repeat protein